MPDGAGYAVTIILADTDGTVRHLRMISLSTSFSRALNKVILEQARRPFDLEDYDKAIEEIYARYSTKDLVKLSSHYSKIGH